MTRSLTDKYWTGMHSIASRKTGPLSSGPVHYNTGPADNIQKYGTGPVDSVQLDLNCTVRQIVRS